MKETINITTIFHCHTDYKTLLQQFKRILKNSNLKFTKQRELILNELFNAKNHLTSEELHKILQTNYPNIKIGIATVYRTLSFLESENFVTTIISEKEAKKYELSAKEHHDHIICQDCDKIVEFVNEEIEQLQNSIAESLGFKVKNHSMQIFGICAECQKNIKEKI